MTEAQLAHIIIFATDGIKPDSIRNMAVRKELPGWAKKMMFKVAQYHEEQAAERERYLDER